jgi:hypothetical protein
MGKCLRNLALPTNSVEPAMITITIIGAIFLLLGFLWRLGTAIYWWLD